ncbi:uncharacterized protein [Chelonus insularis]|uniref:uncharacterized protein n=1 Tax=Chelonus insularis TaxID=460826 RepID=UPI00158F3F9F|nr:uncharacterized protein LOC118072032 [Chelonus insularis]
MWIHLTLCSVTLILCERIHGLDLISEEEPSRTYPYRRAVDGTRGSKYYDPDEDDSFDIYDRYDEETDFSSYRSNVPGEPGIDYPSYTRIPQTSFTCESQFRGYYADEEAGCQLFHVCDGNFLVSSFLCPIGSIFSQKLLTCDWWNKVDCSATKSFYQTVSRDVSEVDDDEYLRKAYEMTSLQSADNGVSIDPRDQVDNLNKNHGNGHFNELQSSEQYPDYQNVPSKSSHPQFKYSSRYSSSPSYNRNLNSFSNEAHEKPSIRIHTIGKDKKDYDENQYNRHRPAYAPTVPTVTTTTRRFYSPTVPSVIKPTTRSRHDLEFESSDHLYSAKGKSRSTTVRSTSINLPSTTERPRIRSTTVPSTSRSPFPSSPLTTQRVTYYSDTPIVTSTTKRPPSTTEKVSFFSATPINVRDDDSSTDDVNTVSKELLNTSDDSNIIHLELIKANESGEENSASREQGNVLSESPIINVIPYSFKNDSDAQNAINSTWSNEANIILPAISFLPPFYYYTNVDQHDSVSVTKSDELEINSTSFTEESTTSWYDESTISVPSPDIIPPIKDRIEELQPSTINSIDNFSLEIDNCTEAEFNNVDKITISPSLEETDSPLIHSIFEINNATYPEENYEYEVVNKDDSKLGITDETLETSTFNYLKDYFDKKKKELLGDLIGGESSPVQVTLTVKNDEDLDPSGEFIRSLIAQHDPISAGQFEDFEIVKSQTPRGGKDSEIFQKATKAVINRQNDRGKFRVNNYAINPSTSPHTEQFMEDKSNDNLPRPFSLNNQGITIPIEAVNEFRQEIRTTTFSPPTVKSQSIMTEENLQSTPKSDDRFNLSTQDRNVNFQNRKMIPVRNENNTNGNMKNWNLTKTKYVVETELVPSIGFSLNTEEERDAYAQALKKGLFTDYPVSNFNKTSNDETNSKS